MKTLADRLKETRTKANLSQTELARTAQVSQTTIAAIESGRSNGSKHLVAIANALSRALSRQITAEWLEKGLHLNLTKVTDPDLDHVGAESNPGGVLVWDTREDLPHDPDRVWMDRYDYRFSAGNGHVQWEVREKNALPFNQGFFKAIGSNPADCRLVVAHGHSMEPFLFDKDMIMVDTKKVEPREGCIYAVYFEGEPLVKQIFKRAGGGLVLHSYNANYPDKVIEPEHLERLQIFGQCVYRSGSGFL